ncbi:SGNH/GDSL hydrolase family protein [Cryobacterium sp. TMT1-66-1]|uniref:SGNH/GDSL hydrolase family protein n=1 Tax=Cryobacterium sp. TMT1-66-1 TaxID=1259242 RepID=UPI00106BE381|nr:SGNH/GDSL hydrolase family protein [Cryobacterium sp. TMT1-66-1]TFD04161.1 SGNH/GDSL hydrolase family protein [Cryobacterium sp. TMT1-66-1]
MINAYLNYPWTRYVALGDSFTEGIGDPEPESVGGNRGWADRVAEVLSDGQPDFSYANLAVRGKILSRISDERVEPVLQLRPDLITISAGGNDVIRPGADPDDIAARFDDVISRLSRSGTTIVLFTGPDLEFSPLFRGMRGKVAIYNENLRSVAARHGCLVVDLWSLTAIQDAGMWALDRLHFHSLGHHTIARSVLSALRVENSLQPSQIEQLPMSSWRSARTSDVAWARTYLVPWVLRRARHQSSGDHILPKRPEASRLGRTRF